MKRIEGRKKKWEGEERLLFLLKELLYIDVLKTWTLLFRQSFFSTVNDVVDKAWTRKRAQDK